MTNNPDISRDAVERLAPERIWAFKVPCGDVHTAEWAVNEQDAKQDPVSTDHTQYIRADHSDAQLQEAVAEMREAFDRMDSFAVKIHDDAGNHYSVRERDFEAIWSIFKRPAPTDALDRAIAAAVNDAWLTAIANIAALRNSYQPGSLFAILNHAVWKLDEARRAAIRARSDAQNKGEG